MRVTALLLALLTTAGAVAACGSAKSDASGKPSARASGNAFAAYTDCLRKNGVTLPSARTGRPSARPSGQPSNRPTSRPSGARGGGFGFGQGDQAPPGVDQQTWQKAQQACSALRPTGGPQGGRDNGAIRAYRNCLADHGVTMSAGPGGLDSNDPKVAAG